MLGFNVIVTARVGWQRRRCDTILSHSRSIGHLLQGVNAWTNLTHFLLCNQLSVIYCFRFPQERVVFPPSGIVNIPRWYINVLIHTRWCYSIALSVNVSHWLHLTQKPCQRSSDDRSRFATFPKNVNILEFDDYIWNKHRKCIQISMYKHAWY